MVDDAWRNKVDRVIVVSNDGDLRDAIAMVRHRYNDMRIKVGVAAPLSGDRRISRVLKKASDFRRNIDHVRNLHDCQLPFHIHGTNIRKPQDWIRHKGVV